MVQIKLDISLLLQEQLHSLAQQLETTLVDRGRLEAQLRQVEHMQAAEAGVADQLRGQLQEALVEVDARYIPYSCKAGLP